MIIVATELHIRSFWHFFEFAIASVRSTKQAKKSVGCIFTEVKNNGWRIGFTLTAWENREMMQQFRNTGAHKQAMSKIRKLSHQYKTVLWESDKPANWEEAKTLLAETAFKVLK